MLFEFVVPGGELKSIEVAEISKGVLGFVFDVRGDHLR